MSMHCVQDVMGFLTFLAKPYVPTRSYLFLGISYQSNGLLTRVLVGAEAHKLVTPPEVLLGFLLFLCGLLRLWHGFSGGELRLK